ncbi:MAG: peptide chain release factor 1, partial [Metallosphaera sp.]
QGTIGVLRGSRIEVLEEMEGYVPGKHMMGGQSQRRIDRIIEELYHEFLKSFGEKVNSYLLPILESGRLKGILLGGPGYAKKEFYDSDYIDYRLKKLVLLPLVDLGYQGEVGLREMVMKSKDLLRNQKYVEVEDLIEELKFHLAKDDGLVVYGKDEISKAMQMGAVDSLLIFDDGNVENEKIMQEAERYGTKVYLVGEEIPEAEWVRKTFNGAVGKLRFKI